MTSNPSQRDGNGNVTGLVDGNTGNPSAQYEYGPFGEVIRMTGSMAGSNPFRFSTKFTDDESDLVYYGFRYYNPSTGRWLSRDPLEENGSVNLYSLCDNDALSYVDPYGDSFISFVLKAGAKKAAMPLVENNRLARNPEPMCSTLLERRGQGYKCIICISPSL